MNAQDLKNSILQLAVQGKLVPQDPADEPASELLERIRKEKERLINEGKLRKEKPLPTIGEDEIPFDIPETWEWVRLPQIAVSGLGKTIDKMKNTGKPTRYLCSINVYWEGINLDNIKEALFTEEEKDKYRLQVNDLLICEGGDVGRTAVWTDPREMYYQNALHRVRFFCGISPWYFKYVMEAYKGAGILDLASKGMGIKHLVQSSLFGLILPLPPLVEQARIVAKIEELLPKIAEYGEAQERLTELNAVVPEQLRRSILQQAVQGKLTDRDPSDEPASFLLDRIRAEKARLIKEGKLREQKPLPPITDDEIPFDIPENWRWTRLGEITSELGDGIHGTPNFDKEGSYFFVNGNNLIQGRIIIKEDTKRLSANEFNKYKKNLTENTVLVSINGTIGNIAYYRNEPIILGKSACFFTLMQKIQKEYISILLATQFFLDYALKQATQTTIKNVSLKAMRYLPIPLPPLAEQARIVERVETLLAKYSDLK